MTAVAPTVTGMSGNASIGFSQIGGWLTIRGGARRHPHRATGGGYRAGEGGGKLGLFLHCQDTALIEDNLDLVVPIMPSACESCSFATTARIWSATAPASAPMRGSATSAPTLLKRLNRLPMAVDCAHTGLEITYDVIEARARRWSSPMPMCGRCTCVCVCVCVCVHA